MSTNTHTHIFHFTHTDTKYPPPPLPITYIRIPRRNLMKHQVSSVHTSSSLWLRHYWFFPLEPVHNCLSDWRSKREMNFIRFLAAWKESDTAVLYASRDISNMNEFNGRKECQKGRDGEQGAGGRGWERNVKERQSAKECWGMWLPFPLLLTINTHAGTPRVIGGLTYWLFIVYWDIYSADYHKMHFVLLL